MINLSNVSKIKFLILLEEFIKDDFKCFESKENHSLIDEEDLSININKHRVLMKKLGHLDLVFNFDVDFGIRITFYDSKNILNNDEKIDNFLISTKNKILEICNKINFNYFIDLKFENNLRVLKNHNQNDLFYLLFTSDNNIFSNNKESNEFLKIINSLNDKFSFNKKNDLSFMHLSDNKSRNHILKKFYPKISFDFDDNNKPCINIKKSGKQISINSEKEYEKFISELEYKNNLLKDFEIEFFNSFILKKDKFALRNSNGYILYNKFIEIILFYNPLEGNYFFIFDGTIFSNNNLDLIEEMLLINFEPYEKNKLKYTLKNPLSNKEKEDFIINNIIPKIK